MCCAKYKRIHPTDEVDQSIWNISSESAKQILAIIQGDQFLENISRALGLFLK